MLAEVAATGTGVFAQHGTEIRWLVALATGFAIVVWRVSAVATLVRIQNGRVAKLEEGVVYRDTCKAMHDNSAQAIEGLTTDLQYIRQRFDELAGTVGGATQTGG